MVNQYLTYTFLLKDGKEVEIEREAYFGFIYAEGFGLKDSLKIKPDKIFYKRLGEQEDFKTCDAFLRFLISDMEEIEDEEEFVDSENYQVLVKNIKKIADIKELKAYYRHYDYKEPEYDSEQKEKISFKKFTGDY